MLELGSVTTIEEIAEALRERRSEGKYSVVFLGARAGEFYGNEDFYQLLKKYINDFDDLKENERFDICYEILSKNFNEKEIHYILHSALKDKYREEDEYLAELVQAGFFDMIITTNIGTLLENAFIPMSMKDPEDYKIFIPEVDSSSEVFHAKPRYSIIVKTFGDLESNRYSTAKNVFNLDMDRILKGFLEAQLQRTTLVIGYDPVWDRGIERAFLDSGETLWYINEDSPQEPSHLASVLKRRGGKYLVGRQGNYKEFLRDLHNLIGRGFSRQQLSETSLPLPQTRSPVRKRAFISYSHKDKEHLGRLQTHLKGYLHAGSEKDDFNIRGDVWDDTQIQTGLDWHEEIMKALAQARVAALLVSADFLASDFIRDYELPELLKAVQAEEVRLLSVLLGPCAWKYTPLSRYQMMNFTSEPLMGMNLYEQEVVWAKLAEQIFIILKTQTNS